MLLLVLILALENNGEKKDSTKKLRASTLLLYRMFLFLLLENELEAGIAKFSIQKAISNLVVESFREIYKENIPCDGSFNRDIQIEVRTWEELLKLLLTNLNEGLGPLPLHLSPTKREKTIMLLLSQPTEGIGIQLTWFHKG